MATDWSVPLEANGSQSESTLPLPTEDCLNASFNTILIMCANTRESEFLPLMFTIGFQLSRRKWMIVSKKFFNRDSDFFGEYLKCMFSFQRHSSCQIGDVHYMNELGRYVKVDGSSNILQVLFFFAFCIGQSSLDFTVVKIAGNAHL
jgi:hypothetical protein